MTVLILTGLALSVVLFAWSVWLWTLAQAHHALMLQHLEQVLKQTAPHHPLPPARVQWEGGEINRWYGAHLSGNGRADKESL